MKKSPDEQPVTPPEPAGFNFAVARQPIYQVADGTVFGYELLYRTLGSDNTALVTSDEEATLSVLSNGILAIAQDVDPTKRLFINFPREILEKGYHRILDKEQFVIEVLERVHVDQAFTDLIRSIRADGYVLALDDYVGDPAFEPILPYVSCVKIDFLALRDDPARLEAIIAAMTAAGKTILAEKVETDTDIHRCSAKHIRLAQGFYYSRPKVVTAKVLEANQAVKLHLLSEISRPDIDIQKIRDSISSDVSLTYKLLRYVNAARFYRGQPIESVEFAIQLLGRDALTSWLCVNLLASLGSSPRDRELAFASAVRGRFLARLDPQRATPCHQGESICLVGLLSLLDAILGLPMREALKNITIDDAMRRGLLGLPGPCMACLPIAREFEGGKASDNHALLRAFGVSRKAAAQAHTEALAWAAEMFRAAD